MRYGHTHMHIQVLWALVPSSIIRPIFEAKVRFRGPPIRPNYLIWPQSHRRRDWPPNQHVGELQLHNHGAAAHAEPGLEKCGSCIGLKEPYLIARYGEKYPGGILLRRI